MAIAIIEDDPVQRRVLRAILEHTGREVVEFADGIAAWESIRQDPSIQLVVTDWMMPGLDGPGLIKKIREAALSYYVYILLLTARQDRTDIVAGLQGGADDYLTKPVDPREFIARVVVGERIVRLEQQLRSSHDEQRYLANHDLLTGAFNRRAFYERFGVLAGNHEAQPISVLMIDIDHFKSINDRFGHHTGDQALQRLVQVVRTCIRASDWLARWGGEEFLVLLPSTDHDQALLIAERIRLAVARNPLLVSDTVSMPINVSIGVTTAPSIALSELDTMLREADGALYTAKDSGRNRVWSAKTGPSSLSEEEVLAPLELPEPQQEAITNNATAEVQPYEWKSTALDGLDLQTVLQAADVLATGDHKENPYVGTRALAQLNHDIRGRFSGVIGMTELLLDTELNEEQRDFAAAILNGNIDLLGILDQMFSRIRAAMEQGGNKTSEDIYTLISRELMDD
jgi:two-component system, cell cycle response regulator